MKLFQVLIIIFLIFVNPISSVFCQDVTLSWDPSPSSEVTGYKVYYKQGSRDLPFDGTGAEEGVSPIDVGDALTITLTNLSDDVNYYFSVTAYSTEAESSFSNIVSNSWLPALVTPANGASGEPVPVTFQWETAPSDYNVTYTLFYGIDRTEVTNAAVIWPLNIPGQNNIPSLMIAGFVAVILLSLRRCPIKKASSKALVFLLISLLGGILTACSGGGGGEDTSGNHSATSVNENSKLYSIDKGSSDYHQAYDLQGSTTYYWKVVATDTQDPNLTYESEVRQFTTEDF